MKLKLFLSGVLVAVGLGLGNPASAGNEEAVHYFPSTIYLENEKLTLPDNLFVFEREGNAYVPLRYMAESMGYHVDYNPNSSTIHLNDMKGIVLGPSVDVKDAKLIAYESYPVKSIYNVTLRPLNDEERMLIPEDARNTQNIIPPYYVLDVINLDNNHVVIYVSSNNTEHYFSITGKD